MGLVFVKSMWYSSAQLTRHLENSLQNCQTVSIFKIRPEREKNNEKQHCISVLASLSLVNNSRLGLFLPHAYTRWSVIRLTFAVMKFFMSRTDVVEPAHEQSSHRWTPGIQGARTRRRRRQREQYGISLNVTVTTAPT